MRADKRRIQHHFARAAATYDAEAGIQHQVAGKLLDLTRSHLVPPVESVLEIGCCTGILTRRLAACLPDLRILYANDLVAGFSKYVANIPCSGEIRFLAGDIEMLALPGTFDLIISSSTLHWLHDLAGLLPRLRAALRPGGLLAFSLYGPDNLQEIRSLTGQGLKYEGLEQIRSLLAGWYQVLESEEQQVRLVFPDPAAVLAHLRKTGVNSLARHGWSRGRHQRFLDAYRRRFRYDQGVRLTYHPMYFVARNVAK